MVSQITFSLNLEIPWLTMALEWTPIDLHEKLLRVVAQASARIFVGYPMCRNEEWLDCSTKFAMDAMNGGEKLKQWHPWLRPIAQYFIPEMTHIHGDHRNAFKLLLPELGKRSKEPENTTRNDMIEWMQQRAKKLGDKSFDNRELANLQMLTATAAIHTTRLAIIHALYDLAARPEYIEPLQKEILGVTKDSDGIFQKQHLTAMKKLDSFMKESQRHNPPSIGEVNHPVPLSYYFIGTLTAHISNVSTQSHGAHRSFKRVPRPRWHHCSMQYQHARRGARGMGGS
jgi:ent-kaurene oxidase